MNTTKRTEISSLGEFGLIEKITKDIAVANKETVKGIGDDAAILQFSGDEETLVTTDLLMEGVHFDLTYFSTEASWLQSGCCQHIRHLRHERNPKADYRIVGIEPKVLY